MNYIYCYENLINKHKYVGQTNNFNRRIREHRSAAKNLNSSSYNDLFHSKLRQYGEENFKIYILETIYDGDQSYVNEREKFWIGELNTHCKNGQGYNISLVTNGNDRGRTKLTDEEVSKIKEDIKNGAPYSEIEKKYNVIASYISAINQGMYYFDENETYPLFAYYKTDEDYDELIDLLLHSSYSMTEIAKLLNIGYSTVKKINSGKLRKGLYPTYPIRKWTPNEIRANQIADLLINTNLAASEIAKICNASDETVRRVNIGATFKKSNVNYPLRTCIDYSK